MIRLWTKTSGMLTPLAPLLPSISRTGRDTMTSRLPATLMSLNPTLQVRPLCQKDTTRLWHRSLLHIEMEPSLGSGFATFHRGKRLRQAHGRLLLSLCQRPLYMSIMASLTRRNHVLKTIKKWELRGPNSTTLPGRRIKNVLKYEPSYQPIWI